MRGLAGLGIGQQKGAPTLGALSAAATVLAWRGLAMPHYIRPLAGGTV
jgi:hypothetical protein